MQQFLTEPGHTKFASNCALPTVFKNAFVPEVPFHRAHHLRIAFSRLWINFHRNLSPAGRQQPARQYWLIRRRLSWGSQKIEDRYTSTDQHSQSFYFGFYKDFLVFNIWILICLMFCILALNIGKNYHFFLFFLRSASPSHKWTLFTSKWTAFVSSTVSS